MTREAVGEALVLLIHGTNAADPADSGERWWQRGSAFWDALSARLGQAFACQPDGEIFRWSGENSESERRLAAMALSKRIERLERDGRPYHLVGHSHGGSVIWLALLRLLAGRADLPGLRSWTTVGTPFLHYKPRRDALWLTLSFAAAVGALALSWTRLKAFGQAFQEALQDPEAWLLPFAALPLLWLVLLGFAVTALVRLLSFARAALKAKSERRTAEGAYRQVGDRHLGLWSEADEAIGGLANTLTAGGAIVPRMSLTPRSLLGRVAGFAILPVRAAYNGVMARASDEFVWDRVVRRLQGNDRFSYDLWAVTPQAVPSAPGWPSVPAGIAEALVENANEEAAATLAKVRNALGVAAEGDSTAPNFLLTARECLSFRELVHNSYFDNETLRELVAAHIEAQGRPQSVASSHLTVAAWLRGGYLDPDRLAAGPQRHRISPRRRILPPLQSALAVGLVGLVWTAAAGIHGGYVYPYTHRAQLDLAINSDAALRIASDQEEHSDAIRDWARILAKTGFDERAEALAKDIPAGEDRAIAVSTIAHEWLSAGESAKAERLLDRTLADIRAGRLTQDNGSVSANEGFHALVRELVHLGREDEAAKLGRRLVGGVAPRDLAAGHADAGRHDRALELLSSIPEPVQRVAAFEEFILDWDSDPTLRLRAARLLDTTSRGAPERLRSRALATVVSTFGRLGRFDGAKAAARSVPLPYDRAEAMAVLAGQLLDRGRLKEARLILEESLATGPSAAASRVMARLSHVASDAALRRRAEALVLREWEESPAGRTERHPETGEGMFGATWAILGNVERALPELSRLASPYVFDGARDVVTGLRYSGKREALIGRIATIERGYVRCALLVALALDADGDERRELLLRAESQATAVHSDEEQSFALGQVAKGWIAAGQYRRALALAERVDSADRLRIYQTLLEDYYDPAP